MLFDKPARSYLNGQWVGGASTGAVAVRNPANPAETVGEAWWAGPADAAAAMDAAQTALPGWRRVPLDERITRLRALLDILTQTAESLAQVITRENGKTLSESRGEVAATIRDGVYQLEQLLSTAELPVPAPGANGVRSQVLREPLGVVLLITPWNFPLATIGRKLIPALALGNTVVVKPSELTPLTAAAFFELLDSCQLPPGVANLVLGEGPAIGPALVQHAALRGISFTGSTRVGLGLAEQTAGRDVRLQLEMGGKNALVVLADADVDAALDAAVIGAFACAGQWCTSTSRVIVERPLYAEFVDRLVRRAQALRLGSGLDPATQMGPLISAAQAQRSVRAIEAALAEGARLAAGGVTPPSAAGHFVAPTVLADVTPTMALAQEEVFGPVLAVLPAEDADDALRLANASPYGLAFSVYTRSQALAERFMREVRAGLCHVNLPTYYREAHMPVCGWQASGRGAPECGDFALEAFTRVRAVYYGAPA